MRIDGVRCCVLGVNSRHLTEIIGAHLWLVGYLFHVFAHRAFFLISHMFGKALRDDEMTMR